MSFNVNVQTTTKSINPFTSKLFVRNLGTQSLIVDVLTPWPRFVN